MIRKPLFRLAMAIAAGCILAPDAEAQAGGWMLGVGGGVSQVRKDGTGESAVRPHLRMTLGRRISRHVAVGVEGTAFGLFDEEPTGFGTPADSIGNRNLVATETVLATVQIDVAPNLYLRPGVGIARHAFTVYDPGDDDVIADAYVGHEGGLAAGLSAGYAFRVGRMALGVEGTAVRSGGEDSTAARWIYGLQVGPTFRF